MKKLFTILFALCLCMSALAADKVKVTVSNSLSFARGDEYVELDVNALKSKLGTDGSLVVTDADGREVASQLTYDGKLIFQVGVPAKGKSLYFVEAGTPSRDEWTPRGGDQVTPIIFRARALPLQPWLAEEATLNP